MLFFLKRLLLMDPVLSIAALAAIPALWRAYRRRETEATVLFAWLAVVFATAFLWSYRNVTCLAPAIPALAILVARAIPPRIAFPIATVALAVKLAAPAQPWTLDLRAAVLHPSVTLLGDYTRQQRHCELILVDPFDGFYSSELPLPKDRYCFVSRSGVPPQGPLDLHYLGIVIFRRRVRASAGIGRRVAVTLQEWDLNSSEAIATPIVPKSRDEVVALIATHPNADFLLPESFRASMTRHTPGAVGGGYLLALAQQSIRVYPCSSV